MTKPHSVGLMSTLCELKSGVVEANRWISEAKSSPLSISKLDEMKILPTETIGHLDASCLTQHEGKEEELSPLQTESTPYYLSDCASKAKSLRHMLHQCCESDVWLKGDGYEVSVTADGLSYLVLVMIDNYYDVNIELETTTSHPHIWKMSLSDSQNAHPDGKQFLIHFMKNFVIPWTTKKATSSDERIHFEDMSSVSEYELLLDSGYTFHPEDITEACMSGNVRLISWMRYRGTIRNRKQKHTFPYSSIHVLESCGVSSLDKVKEMANMVYSRQDDGLEHKGPFPAGFFRNSWESCCYDNIEWYLRDGYKIYGEPEQDCIREMVSKCLDLLEIKEERNNSLRTCAYTSRQPLTTKEEHWSIKYIPIVKRIHHLCELLQFRHFRIKSRL